MHISRVRKLSSRLLPATVVAISLLNVSTAAAQPVPALPFIEKCGLQLCAAGQPFRIHGATTYGQLDHPEAVVDMAKQERLNTIEIVEYERDYHRLDQTMTEATWLRVDRLIAVAKANGLRVVLNLSSYGKSLKDAGQKPTTVDWQPFLQFVGNRVNTETGIAYRDEPAIALLELYGEIDAPNYGHEAWRSTTQEINDFYARTLAQAQAAFPQTLVSTGGFSYLNDSHSGIDWQTIMRDPNNDVCSVEINSAGDRNITIPAVSAACAKAGKPWFLAAWSSCLRAKPEYDGDLNSWPDDSARAAHARDMYAVADNDNPKKPAPAVPAVGTDFWNLGDSGICDIGPASGQTLAAVQLTAQRSNTRPLAQLARRVSKLVR